MSQDVFEYLYGLRKRHLALLWRVLAIKNPKRYKADAYLSGLFSGIDIEHLLHVSIFFGEDERIRNSDLSISAARRALELCPKADYRKKAQILDILGRACIGTINDLALNYLDESLGLRLSDLKGFASEVAESYDSHGFYYTAIASERLYKAVYAMENGLKVANILAEDIKKDLDKAKEYHYKALDVRVSTNSKLLDISDAYLTIGRYLHEIFLLLSRFIHGFASSNDRLYSFDDSESIAAYTKALDIKREILGEDNPEVIGLYLKLAVLSGSDSSALEYKLRALQIYKSREDHFMEMKYYSEIASIHESRKDYGKALFYRKEAYKVSVHCGKANTLDNLMSLTRTCILAEDFENASKCCNEIFESPDCSSEKLFSLAYVYRTVGNEAGQKFVCDLVKKRVSCEQQCDDLGWFCEDVGKFCRENNEHLDAIWFFDKEREIFTSLYGDNYLDVADAYRESASEYSLMEDHVKSVALYEKAVSIYQGHEYFNFLSKTCLALAREYCIIGRQASALECLRSCLDIGAKKYPNFDAEIASIKKMVSEIEGG